MADQPLYSRTTLAVLAGGRGSRMGGPKDRLMIGGKPVLNYLLDRFEWTGPTLLVTAPGASAMTGSERFTSIVSDPVEGEGPLRGALTALAACTTEMLVVTTVDMPGWDRSKLRWLIAALDARPQSLGVMLRHGKQVEPFPLAIRGVAVASVTALFDQGVRSVMALSDDPRIAALEAPSWPAPAWTNLNRPEDVVSFELAEGITLKGAAHRGTPQ